MFQPTIQLDVAAIFAGAACRALAGQVDRSLAFQILGDVRSYVEHFRMLELRNRAIQISALTSEREDVSEEAVVTPVEAVLVERYLGNSFAGSIRRKFAKAVRIASAASEDRTYFPLIVVTPISVTVLHLPWVWGYRDWETLLEGRAVPASDRDTFLVATLQLPGKNR